MCAMITSPGMNSTYWAKIDMLSGNIYNKDTNVIPYMPDKDFLFTDFYPTLSVGTVLRVYFNSPDTYFNVTVVDSYGTIYFIERYNLGLTKIRITDSSGNDLKNYDAIAINTYLYYEISSADEANRLIELMRIKNDFILDTARDDQLYNNFGYILTARKPNDFSYAEYRNVLGSFKDAFLNGGTTDAFNLICEDVTGSLPTITYDFDGWQTRRYPHYINSTPTPTLPSPVLIELESREEVVYRQSSLATPDLLIYSIFTATTTMNYVPVTIVYDNFNTYVESVDYTLSNISGRGAITWTGSGDYPTSGTHYSVEYATQKSSQTHYYTHTVPSDDTKERVNPAIKVYSANQKAYSIRLQVNDSTRAITDEAVTKSGDGEIDILANSHVAEFYVNNELHIGATATPTMAQLGYDISKYEVVPTTVNDVVVLYTDPSTGIIHQSLEGVSDDFTVNRSTGIISFLPTTNAPVPNANYTVSYTYGSLCHITATPTVYYEGTEYDMDRAGGRILWRPSVAQPLALGTYSVDYRYVTQDIIEAAIEKAKPAHIRVYYSFLP